MLWLFFVLLAFFQLDDSICIRCDKDSMLAVIGDEAGLRAVRFFNMPNFCIIYRH